jgi:pSer/pThr/pTyr-binding forkhead associated (FHA) protein
VDDKQVSRRHARIVRHEEQYVLEDLNSANATFLNGGAVRVPTELRNGDRIQLGDVVLEVVL